MFVLTEILLVVDWASQRSLTIFFSLSRLQKPLKNNFLLEKACRSEINLDFFKFTQFFLITLSQNRQAGNCGMLENHSVLSSFHQFLRLERSTPFLKNKTCKFYMNVYVNLKPKVSLYKDTSQSFVKHRKFLRIFVFSLLLLKTNLSTKTLLFEHTDQHVKVIVAMKQPEAWICSSESKSYKPRIRKQSCILERWIL